MKLDQYDGKIVRIEDIFGSVYEGPAVFDHAEYIFHEYGIDEDGLMIDDFLFPEGNIRKVEEIEEKEIYVFDGRNQHTMMLNEDAFRLIEEGKKTIELRLYDEKRQQIRVGDLIRFVDLGDETEVLRMIVEVIFVFNSFKELYEKLPLRQCGYSEEELKIASYKDMDVYYSEERQKKYKACGLKLKPFAEE